MESQHMLSILQKVQEGALDIHTAYEKLKISPFEDLGYAKIDHHRQIRQGAGGYLRHRQNSGTDGRHSSFSFVPLPGKYSDHPVVGRICRIPVPAVLPFL